ncbi:putative LPS assembly protein LptD [Nibrella saemangeumensis]|uniref:LPS assembly protein LptD n=1 Tax=Nibrella saemangeumensis TaxID=1084526 RepID=A0ABP8NER6_9BACT
MLAVPVLAQRPTPRTIPIAPNTQFGPGRSNSNPASTQPNAPRTNQTAPVNAPATVGASRDTITRDSLQAASDFRTTVKYSSKDSSFFDNNTQTLELFGDAEVNYGDISLKADYIRLNYTTNEVYAKGRYDSTTKKMVGQPVFKDGEGQYDTKEIRYNFKSKKGLIQGVVTSQGEGNIRGTNVKKDEEDNLYIRGAIYTTCNLATPHFHINASKIKVVHNKQVVAGPFNLVINQVPLPIGLPFGFFPFPKKKDIGVSGVLMPQYGEEPNGRGYYLRDGGYYWAVSENLGLQFKGQIYSRGSWGLGVTSAYNKRYRFSGNIDLRFNRNRSGDRIDTTQTPRNDFAVIWSHAPQSVGKRGTFSANVNVSSNSYNQFNSFDQQRYVSNVAGSSVQYSRSFGQYVRASANARVNQQFGQVNRVTNVRENGRTDASTNFNLGVNQIAPFALKGGSGRWYESFRVGFDFSGSAGVSNTIRNRLDTTGLGFRVVGRQSISRVQLIRDSIARAERIRRGETVADPNLIAFNMANLPTILRNAQIEGRYSIPIGLPNLKLLRYINLTPGFSFSGDLYTKRLNYSYLGGDSVRVDTTKGLYTVYNFAVSASMNTRMYGTVFLRGKRLEAIRHTFAPSVSFSYVPNFSDPSFGFFQDLSMIPGLRTTQQRVSRFRGLGGSAGSSLPGASAFISFGIVNQLEMKVRTRDDTSGQEFRKVPLFDNISLTGSYNMLAQEYPLSPLQLSANTQIFKNISFNFSSTFDPYAYRLYGGNYTFLFPGSVVPEYVQAPVVSQQNFTRVNYYAIQAGQGLLRMTNMQAYLSTRLAPKSANKPKQSPNASDNTMRAINANPELYVDFNVPWTLNVSYTLGINKFTPTESSVIQALTLTGDFSLTPKWKFTFNSGYDFQAKSPSLTTIGISRDLHCWEMNFNWTPFAGSSFRASNYSFDLRARSAILQELKLSRRRTFYDRGGF